MAINGRINVDVLFHDTDGTTSLKVVSLEDSTEYSVGKVAVVTGTCGTTAVTIANLGGALAYRDASGAQVSFSSFDRMAVQGSSGLILAGAGQYADMSLVSTGGRVAVCDKPPQELIVPVSGSLNIRTKGGTASYTVVIYGT